MLYKYQLYNTPGPDGTTLFFNNTENNTLQEISIVDGWRYVYVPDGEVPPDQPTEINWQPVELNSTLRESIKAGSPQCRFINETMQNKIRSKYALEDEQYFSRIGIGAALGVYQFEPGEQEALLAFGEYVETVRQWGREQRQAIGF